MKKVSIFNDDCLKKMKDLPDNSVDLILCDLPYGTTKCKWDSVLPLDELWALYKRLIKKPTGVIALFADQPFTSILISSNLEMFKYEWIWKKSRTTGFLLANFRPMKLTEDILIFSFGGGAAASKDTGNHTYNPQNLIEKKVLKKNSPKRIGRMLNQVHHLGENNKLLTEKEYSQKYTNYPTEILDFNNEKNIIHPTQKPIALCEYLIKTYSNEGDLVLDNTMGSGTTGVACVNTNRRFIGIEKEKEYFEIAKRRIEEAEKEKNKTEPKTFSPPAKFSNAKSLSKFSKKSPKYSGKTITRKSKAPI